MPNYKIADLLENPENTQRLYGYCGKIARINLTTREVSTLRNLVFAAWTIFPDTPVLPDIAATGETFDACLAGDWAAINTVIIPTAAPQRIPFILTENSGISTHSPFTINFNTAHDTQQVTVPNAQPIGIAVLHQFNASSLQKILSVAPHCCSYSLKS